MSSVESFYEEKKLDQQLNKLRKCKAEMNAIFKDLKKIIPSDSESSRESSPTDRIRSFSINKFENYNYSSNSDSDDLPSSNQYNMKYDNEYSSESSYDSDSYYRKNEPQIRTKKAAFNFKYKIPNYTIDYEQNRTFDLEQIIQTAKEIHRSNSVNDLSIYKNQEDYSKGEMKKFKKKRPNSSIGKPKFAQIKPKWRPNGKFNKSEYQNLYGSNLSLNTQAFSYADKSLQNNPKIMKPFKPVLKTKPDPPIFLSSQDLSKSKESINSNKSKKIPSAASTFNDMDKGWKHVGKIKINNYPKEDSFLVKQSIEKLKDARKAKVEKKVFDDSKDIGDGWKSVGKIKKNDYPKADIKLAETQTNEPRIGDNKKFTDPKDIGDGWKHVGKIKKNDYPKTDPNLFENLFQEAKKINTEQNPLPPWKPNGVTKSIQMVSAKPPLPTTNVNNNDVQIKKSETLPKNKWIPAAKLKSIFPNTWQPPVKSIDLPKKITKKTTSVKKTKNVMITSTPNMSIIKSTEINVKPDESLIFQDNPDNLSKNDEIKNVELEENMAENSDANLNKKNSNQISNSNELIKKDDLNEKLSQENEENSFVESEFEQNKSKNKTNNDQISTKNKLNENKNESNILNDNNSSKNSKTLNENSLTIKNKKITEPSNDEEEENLKNDDDNTENKNENSITIRPNKKKDLSLAKNNQGSKESNPSITQTPKDEEESYKDDEDKPEEKNENSITIRPNKQKTKDESFKKSNKNVTESPNDEEESFKNDKLEDKNENSITIRPNKQKQKNNELKKSYIDKEMSVSEDLEKKLEDKNENSITIKDKKNVEENSNEKNENSFTIRDKKITPSNKKESKNKYSEISKGSESEKQPQLNNIEKEMEDDDSDEGEQLWKARVDDDDDD